MDPTQCYLELLAAMRDGDLQLARELAEALNHWLANGGFYPSNYTNVEVDGYLASVLRRTCGIER